MNDTQDLLRQRFEAKWKRDPQSGCWLWTASTAGKGYGQLRIPGTRRNVYAHRFSYELYRGAIPPGMQLLHSCDNPRCVNPDHLSIGTCKENLQDMKEKDRSTFGERNQRAVLSKTQVEAIKILLASGAMSQGEIAKQFGVHQVQVSRIGLGKQWARVRPDLTMTPNPIIRRA